MLSEFSEGFEFVLLIGDGPPLPGPPVSLDKLDWLEKLRGLEETDIGDGARRIGCPGAAVLVPLLAPLEACAGSEGVTRVGNELSKLLRAPLIVPCGMFVGTLLVLYRMPLLWLYGVLLPEGV